MQKRSSLAVVLWPLLAMANDAVTTTSPEYICGQGDEDKTYATWDTALLCLFFDNMVPPQKVVFTPQVDKFEALQIKGIYEQFKSSVDGDLQVTAMSNGVRSRPAIFKRGEEIAQILNLVVGLEEGKISNIEWRNNCFDMQGCRPDDCEDTSVDYGGKNHNEFNCFRSGCAGVSDYSCDTQVFVTWVGRDNGRDDCTSDNYRISSFYNFGIVSYLNSARALANF